MQRVLDWIEETLEAEIEPAELADRAGYSLWHFLHRFRQEVGMPLCRYRTKRRLAHAIYAVSRGMGVTEAALRWGFGSHSGFYRAFSREYGASPRAWLKAHRAVQPIVPLLKEEVFSMLNRDVFQQALTQWGLDLPLTPVTYPSGHISETAMYAGEELMLKAYRDGYACRLADGLSRALEAEGLPAALLLPLPSGELSVPAAEGWQITLCRRLPGTPLRADELIRSPEKGCRIGEALAVFHRAAARVEEMALADDEPYADHLLNWALPTAREALPADFPADYAQQAEKLRALPAVLIHRDPNPSNLIDTGSGIGFIDFDLSRRCARIFDPCYTATAVLSEVFGQEELPWAENWPVFVHSVLAGYDSVSPLTAAERAAVPAMLIGNELLALAAFADSSKYRDVFEVNQRMLGWMLKHLPA